MTWELISLKPHPHRGGGDDAMALLSKAVRRSEREGVNAIQCLVDVNPLPMVIKQGADKQLMQIEKAQFRVTVDIAERKVMFDIGGADAALPTILRGGGLGSLAISELITWCKNQFPEFAVVTGRISASILNFPNAEPNAIRCLKNFGFAVSRSPVGGLQFEAISVAHLVTHINTAKVEKADPVGWATGLVQSNLKLAEQLLAESRDVSGLKVQLHQLAQVKQSPVPFIGGLLAGSVMGTALAALLFTL